MSVTAHEWKQARSRERKQRYRQKPEAKLHELEYNRLARQQPERANRDNVRRRTLHAIEIGWILRPDTCDRCNGSAALSPHHLSYDEPNSHWDVIFLCDSCHKKEHCDG